MKDYQNDKYENFFRNLRVSREALVAFAAFTVKAVGRTGVDALIAGHGPALDAATASLRTDIVKRQGQGGSTQAGTSTEQAAFAAFKTFLTATDKKVLGPYFYDHEDERAAYYPDNLGGLTQARVQDRLTRLTAYTEALETAPDKTVRAQGAPARALLTAYQQASAAKTTARAELQDTIGDLGPAALAVAEGLFDVHTAACYAHRRAPLQARRYFDYAALPNRVNPKKPVVSPKVA